MKIIIKQRAEDYNNLIDFDDVELDVYNLKAVLSSNDEMNATQVCKMFFKAMVIEGFLPKSIAQAMYDVADYEAYQGGYSLDKYNDEDIHEQSKLAAQFEED